MLTDEGNKVDESKKKRRIKSKQKKTSNNWQSPLRKQIIFLSGINRLQQKQK
jgi:hypothetical protein